MYCRKCGAQNADDAVECVRCRASLQPIAQPASPSIEDDPAMRMILPVGRSGLAIAAGYVGLLSLGFFFLGPVAVVLSILAMRDIRRNPKRRGMGRTVFGLITGIIGTIVLILMILTLTLADGHTLT